MRFSFKWLGICSALLLFTGCGASVLSGFGLNTLDGLAGVYTGVSQVTGGTLVVPRVNLLQTVTVTKLSELTVSIEADIIPKFTAAVVNVDEAAVSLIPLNFDAADRALEIQEIGFAKNEDGHWLLVMQLASLPIGSDPNYLVQLTQFGSYPPETAQQMSQDDAVTYLNAVLKLVPLLAPPFKN